MGANTSFSIQLGTANRPRVDRLAGVVVIDLLGGRFKTVGGLAVPWTYGNQSSRVQCVVVRDSF